MPMLNGAELSPNKSRTVLLYSVRVSRRALTVPAPVSGPTGPTPPEPDPLEVDPLEEDGFAPVPPVPPPGMSTTLPTHPAPSTSAQTSTLLCLPARHIFLVLPNAAQISPSCWPELDGKI